MQEGKLEIAVCALDPEVDMACGMCLLRGSTMLPSAQVEVAADFLSTMLAGESWATDTIARIAKSVTSKELESSMRRVSVMLDPLAHSDVEVEDAIEKLSNEDETPTHISSIFSHGSGRRCMLQARSQCLQRAIDSGGDHYAICHPKFA